MHDDRNDLKESRGRLLRRCLHGRKRYAILVYFVVAAICVGTALLMVRVRAGAAPLTQKPSTRTRRGRVCYKERSSKRLM